MAQTVEDLCQAGKITYAQLVERSGLEETRVQAILLQRWTPSPAERKLEQLAELRAQLARSVDRRALFGMARDRGLPHHQIFFMTSDQLLDAIVSAEGLPPADVLPSGYTEERMSAIAAEARLRHDEIVVAEAAELDAG